MGYLVDRIHRDLSDDDIARIARTYHAWRARVGEGSALPREAKGLPYQDIPGFCKSATIEEIASHGFVLTPGRYVGAQEIEDDDEPFDEKMKRLTATLRQQQAEAAKLDTAITANLKELGYGR
jgi:type I restriction enzyme M protein